jgi:4-amino-4-deoxy-L-arabinose transferase-like glycosyltransferase
MIVLGWGEKLVGLRAAFLASILLLLSIGFVVVGRYVVMDAGFTCCVVGMSLALILAEGTAWRWSRARAVERADQESAAYFWLVAAGVFAGIGVLFKGPAIFVLALPPVIAAYALEGRLNFFWHFRVLFCLVPCLMIGAPWYVAMAWFDPAFLGDFLWRQNLMRFSKAFDHEAPWWFYLPVTLIMMFPASYLLPALGKYLLSSDSWTRGRRTSGQGFLVLMGGWVILFFSCSESKLVTYMLPAIPLIALLIGAMLDETVFGKAPATAIEAKAEIARPSVRSMIRQVPLHNLPFLSPLGFVFISVSTVLALNLLWDCPLPGPPVLLAVGWVVLFVIALIPWRYASKVGLNWICLGITGLGMILTLQHVLIPNLAQMRSLNQALVRLSRQDVFRSAPVVFFERHPYAAELEMSNREIKYFETDEAIEFRDFIADHPLALIVASDTNIKRYCNTLARQVELVRSEESKYIYLCKPRTQTAVQVKEASPIRQR